MRGAGVTSASYGNCQTSWGKMLGLPTVRAALNQSTLDIGRANRKDGHHVKSRTASRPSESGNPAQAAFDWPSTRPARPQAGSDAARWPELELLAGLGDSRQHGAYHVRRIAMPAPALGSDRCQALRDMCMRASQLAFGVDMNEYWRARPAYLTEVAEWSVADRDGELAGWHGMSVWPAACGTVLYTDMLVTLPAHRRTGLGALFALEAWLRVASESHSLPIVACRTQNPVVMRMIEQLSTVAYPRADRRSTGRVYSRAAQAAEVVWNHKQTGTPPSDGTLISRSTFPCPLCDGLHHSGDPRTDKLFEQLDLDAGDAVYALGWVSPRGALQTLARCQVLRARFAFSARRERKER